MPDLPQSVAFFSSVEVDRVLRKDANAECTTPSNPHGLSGGYGIAAGESLTMTQAIRQAGGAGGGDLTQWPWHRNGASDVFEESSNEIKVMVDQK